MAIYRKINTTFWSDPFICDLDPDKKLFYLYILTNERTKQCGIYDISKRQISFDLSININKVTENINFFSNNGKIMFSELTNEIAIKNWDRFNGSTSPKVVKCVESELKLIKNRVLIDYIYSIDTLSQQTPTEEEEQTPIQKDINPNLSVDWDKLKDNFNELTGKNTKVVSTKVKGQINARLKEGYTKQDLWNAILNCFNDPYHKENPRYLTLEFISRSDKMEKYCSEVKKIKPKEDKL